mgnify:CR=1 FL=1
MAKKTRKIFSYGSMSLSIFRRFVLTLIFSISCLFVSLKVLSIYAQEVAESPSIAPEATIEQPVDIPVQTDNSPSVPDAPSASETPTDIPTDSSVNSDPSSDTTSEVPQVSDPIPEVPTVSPEASPEASSEISSPSSSESSTPETSTSSEQSTIDSDPEVIMAELIAVLLGEAEKEAEENPEKDPEDTTDEDPNVDLQDLSLVSQAPAPELEPMISVAEIQEEELSESTDSSASLISLLDSGVDTIPLLTRIVSEEINTDIAARHSCRLEKFRADVSESSALKMRVKFLA